MKNNKKLLAGVLSCLLLCLSLFSAYSMITTHTDSDKKGYNRYEIKTITEDIYEKEEFLYENTVKKNTIVSLFKNEELTYHLKDIIWEDDLIKNRNINLISTTDYGYTTTTPNGAYNKEVIYYDNRSDKTLKTTLKRVDVSLKGTYKNEGFTNANNTVIDNAIVDRDKDKQVDEILDNDNISKEEKASTIYAAYGYAWRDDLRIPLKATLTGEYLRFRDIYIPYNEKQPNYSDFEETILDSLHLDKSKYMITGSHWDNKVVTENGEEVRYGYYTGKRYSANYVVSYEGNLKLPGVKGYRATLIYETYVKKNLAVPVTFALSLLGLATLVGLSLKKRINSKENKQ